MKLTIIIPDNSVYIDGVCRAPLDLSQYGIPTNIWVLQWKDTTGWVEFEDNSDGTKPANQPIAELPEWASLCITAWENYQPPAPPAPPEEQPVTNQI